LILENLLTNEIFQRDEKIGVGIWQKIDFDDWLKWKIYYWLVFNKSKQYLFT
jgi:hypothetical protein